MSIMKSIEIQVIRFSGARAFVKIREVDDEIAAIRRININNDTVSSALNRMETFAENLNQIKNGKMDCISEESKSILVILEEQRRQAVLLDSEVAIAVSHLETIKKANLLVVEKVMSDLEVRGASMLSNSECLKAVRKHEESIGKSANFWDTAYLERLSVAHKEIGEHAR